VEEKEREKEKGKRRERNNIQGKKGAENIKGMKEKVR
jgi:hypothetical protein